MMDGPAHDLARLLAAAAAEPGLDGLLLLDASPEFLLTAGDLFGNLLRMAGGRPPHRQILASYLSEDDLWIRLAVRRTGQGQSFVPRPGRLVQSARDPVTLVVIPDLARLTIAAQRAVVMLLDTPAAYLERHGQHRRWKPRLRWLAGCAAADIGEVSMHILDRFPTRFIANRAAPGSGTPPSLTEPAVILQHLPAGWTTALSDRAAPPSYSDEAVARAALSHSAPASIRRAIALSRLARGIARLDASRSVMVSHVDEAARLTGLELKPELPDPDQAEPARPAGPQPVPGHSGASFGSGRRVTTVPTPSGPLGPAPKPSALRPEPVTTAETSTSFPAADVPAPALSSTPYPEDIAKKDHDAAPLSTPHQHGVTGRADRGPVIGVRPATELRDLAWVPTLIEAAKYQPIRRRHLRRLDGAGLILSPTDLRSHRRAFRTEFMLALVLDHTCLQRGQLAGMVASYLQWAYVRRSAVCVVEVGAAGTRSELRAELFMGRNARDAFVQAALQRSRGRATPLAHGLELARDTLQHATQHGWSQITEAWLVVVTDGLANVPLAASLTNSAALPWAGRGIEDAITVAARIAALKSVRAVVVAPSRVPHPELPARLAAAMGAGLVRVQPAVATGETLAT
jgi:magnesium chelatase subunit D